MCCLVACINDLQSCMCMPCRFVSEAVSYFSLWVNACHCCPRNVFRPVTDALCGNPLLILFVFDRYFRNDMRFRPDKRNIEMKNAMVLPRRQCHSIYLLKSLSEVTRIT